MFLSLKSQENIRRPDYIQLNILLNRILFIPKSPQYNRIYPKTMEYCNGYVRIYNIEGLILTSGKRFWDINLRQKTLLTV